MNNHPFWSHSQLPRHPYYYYSPSTVFQTQQPVHHSPQPVQHNPARKPSSSVPKRVQIPVKFVDSELAQPVVPARSKSGSAVKIQKVFRGFLVRKSLKKIQVIEKEVEDIEKRVSTNEYVELLRENERERLKVNEMLMALLFKLDSIRGFDSGVRDRRKAVIKKAVAIQERVDAIAAAKIDVSEVAGASDEPDDQKEKNMTEMHQSEEQKEEGSITKEAENAGIEGSESEEFAQQGATQSPEEQKEDSVRNEVGNAENETSEGGEVENMRASSEGNRDGLDESEVEDEKVENRACNTNAEEKDVGIHLVRKGEEEECDEKEEGTCGECECMESEDEKVETRGKEEEEGGCDEKEKGMWDMSECSEMSDTENADGGREENGKAEKQKEEEEEKETCDTKENEMWGGSESVENVDVAGEEEDDDLDAKQAREGGGRDAKERNTELLERMMVENAKMMRLMTQLFERNEMQTRTLNSLAQRVEQLEKAFVCDRMRRNKKKRRGA